MKFKDIKNQLKDEHRSVQVPDMLSRVKRAPINKLLSGETPAQAFQKKLAVRLLVTATALLVAAVFCFAALLLFTENGQASPRCYISLRVESGDLTESYGIVVSGDITTAVCIDENTKQKAQYSSISALYNLKSTDKVTVCAICEDAKIAARTLANFKDELVLFYGDLGGATLTTSANSPAAIDLLREYVGGDESDDIAKLIEKYAASI